MQTPVSPASDNILEISPYDGLPGRAPDYIIPGKPMSDHDREYNAALIEFWVNPRSAPMRMKRAAVPGWSAYKEPIWGWRYFRTGDKSILIHHGMVTRDSRSYEVRANDEKFYFSELRHTPLDEMTGVGDPSTSMDFKSEKRPGDVYAPDGAVMLAKVGKFDFWFPRGGVHAIAGASGSGKSTFTLKMLETQQTTGSLVLGHRSAGLTYIVLFADRGEYANQVTMDRLGLDSTDPRYQVFDTPALDMAAVYAIKDRIEEQEEIPDVVFIEGADQFLSKPNESPNVSQFLKGLQKIAAHYFISIILSVGSGKNKGGDKGYVIQRESIYGSVAWGRNTETVVCINYAGDETNTERVMVASHRNAAAEKFAMCYENGVLVQMAEVPADLHPIADTFASNPDKEYSLDELVESLDEAGTPFSRTAVWDHIKRLQGEERLSRSKERVDGVYKFRWLRNAPKK